MFGASSAILRLAAVPSGIITARLRRTPAQASGRRVLLTVVVPDNAVVTAVTSEMIADDRAEDGAGGGRGLIPVANFMADNTSDYAPDDDGRQRRSVAIMRREHLATMTQVMLVPMTTRMSMAAVIADLVLRPMSPQLIMAMEAVRMTKPLTHIGLFCRSDTIRGAITLNMVKLSVSLLKAYRIVGRLRTDHG